MPEELGVGSSPFTRMNGETLLGSVTIGGSRELFWGGGGQTRPGHHKRFDFISYIKTLSNYLRMHREQALLCSLEDVNNVVAAIR